MIGSHHRWLTKLVADDRQDCFDLMDFFDLAKNGIAYYPGPVQPQRTDCSPIGTSVVVVVKN